MSKRKDDRNEEPNGVFYFDRIDIPLVIAIIGVVTVIVFAFIAASPADGFWPKTFIEVVDVVYTTALILGGLVTLLFAGLRVNHGAKESERRDREVKRQRLADISNSFQSARKSLLEPTDGSKQVAISEIENICLLHPAEKLHQSLELLCSHVKEYDPLISTMELQLIKGDAEDKCDRERLGEIKILNGQIQEIKREPGDADTKRAAIEAAEKEIRTIKEPVHIQNEYDRAYKILLRDEREKRTRHMVRKLVGAVNRLALKVGHTDPETNERREDELLASIDLREAGIFSTVIHNITVSPDRFAGCMFDDVTFVNCKFTGTFEKSTKFLNCTFRYCKFGLSEMLAVNFKNSDFSGSRFGDSTLNGVVWYDCIFSRVELARIKISKKLSNVFSSCDMSGVIFHFEMHQEFKQAHREIADSLRWNYLSTDFQTNYIEKGAAPPYGLEMVFPLIKVELRQGSEDGTRQYFSVESDEESP